MAEPTLYLFDGHNILHAGAFHDPREVVDRLAGFVAERGASGVVVFDGTGSETTRGPLQVRYASPADTLLERLAAESQEREAVCVVSSDRALGRALGGAVRHLPAKALLEQIAADASARPAAEERPSRLEDAVDAKTRERLEEWRRRS